MQQAKKQDSNLLSARNDYCENGFTVVRNLIDKSKINGLLESINELYRLQLEANGNEADIFTDESSLFANMQKLLSLDKDAYLGTIRCAAKMLATHQLLTCNEVVHAAKEIVGTTLPTLPTEPVMHVMSDKLKIPDGYYGFAAHQDWPSIQGSLDVIIAWIPLVDVTTKNFPILILPKSHKHGIIEGEVTKNAMQIDESKYRESDLVPAEARKGDVIFFSGFTMHKTGIDNCSGFRLATSIRYENAHEPYFIKRNFPCAYQRSVHRELFTPNFPSKEQVSAVFDKPKKD